MAFYGQFDSIGDEIALADVGVVQVFGCFDAVLSGEVCVVVVTGSALVAGKDTDDHQVHRGSRSRSRTNGSCSEWRARGG